MAYMTCPVCGGRLADARGGSFICPECGISFTGEQIRLMMSGQTEDSLWDFQLRDDGAALCACYDDSPEVIVPPAYRGRPVTCLESGAFYYKKKLRHVSLPDTVHTIGSLAFCKCYQLEKINMPECLRTIGRDAFSHCLKLENPDLPGTLENIMESAFSGCGSLSELHIPDSVRTLHLLSFYDCRKLSTLTLPSRLDIIEDSALCNCSALTELELPGTLTSIGIMAFWGCTNLKRLRIPPSVKSIGQLAFGAPGAPKPLLLVERDSFAERWAAENNCTYRPVN